MARDLAGDRRSLAARRGAATGRAASGCTQGSSAPKAASPAKKAAPIHTVAGGKVIKVAAEYNDYIAALNLAAPAIKAGAMEAFVAKYPANVIKIDALEQAMAAYQRAGNTAKLEETANRILELKSDHVRALAIVTLLAKRG